MARHFSGAPGSPACGARPHTTGPFRHGAPDSTADSFQTMALATRIKRASREAPSVADAFADTPKDVLVFERMDAGFSLIGGTGRGAGWAGLVDVPDAERTLVRRAWTVGVPVRVAGRRPQQVVGPYHARFATAIPVGDRHVVVVGSNRPIELTDGDAV